MPPTEPGAVHGPTRRDPRLLWIVAAALLVARVVLGILEARNPPPRPDLMSWVAAAEAPARARATGRPILYDFTAEWCGPCQRMEREVYGDERQAQAVMQLVTPVKVVDRQREDGHNAPPVDSLQRAHKVTAFPTLVVVDSTGRAVERLEGYPGSRQMLGWLTRASVQGHTGTKPGATFSFP